MRMSVVTDVSVKLMGAVWALRLPPSEKFVLLALADNANDDGTCWPSVSTISGKTSLAERTVRSVIHRLRDLGHVSISERYGRSNVFTVTPATDAPLQALHPAAAAPTPATDAPPPLQPVQVTPAIDDTHKRTIKESSVEPSKESPRALKRATRIPEDFALTPERKAVAEEERCDPLRTFATFTDYWKAVSGEKARKHDWDATWRNWCRRQADGSKQANQPRKGRADQLISRLEARINGE